MLAVNSIIQEALELTSMVGDGEAADGTLAASALGLLNRVIARLNNDNYFSSTQDYADIGAAGKIYFKKLEEGETFESFDGSACVDMEPPESIAGVSRKLGIRWLQLLPSNPAFAPIDVGGEGETRCVRILGRAVAVRFSLR